MVNIIESDGGVLNIVNIVVPDGSVRAYLPAPKMILAALFASAKSTALSRVATGAFRLPDAASFDVDFIETCVNPPVGEDHCG